MLLRFRLRHVALGAVLKFVAPVVLMLMLPTVMQAQIGDHRNDLSIGFSGGYVMSNVGFTPKVTQDSHTGITFGLSMRYTCEKYFNTICSIAAEVNYARIGWKESILTTDDQPVINPTTGIAEAYQRDLDYIQVPIFAHLAWGREQKGMQFFFKAGPQFGLYLSDSQKTNFSVEHMPATDNNRVSPVVAQDTMAVKNKLDYGIAAGMGVEYSHPKVGHFLLEGRYYYGLGNIYGDSKRDYFAKSNHSNIVVKLTYLFDVIRSK